MASEVAAVFDVAAAIAAMAATGVGTEMKINEALSDYTNAITDVQERSTESADEAQRKIGTTRSEGILTLREQAAQTGFEGRMAMTAAEMAASREEARLGASGVRAKGSPLAAAQQNVDLAYAAADRQIESGNAQMKIGGLRLTHSLGDISAQSTLLTSEYSRQSAELTRKKTELEKNKAKMIAVAVAGGLPGIASSFYNASKLFS